MHAHSHHTTHCWKYMFFLFNIFRYFIALAITTYGCEPTLRSTETRLTSTGKSCSSVTSWASTLAPSVWMIQCGLCPCCRGITSRGTRSLIFCIRICRPLTRWEALFNKNIFISIEQALSLSLSLSLSLCNFFAGFNCSLCFFLPASSKLSLLSFLQITGIPSGPRGWSADQSNWLVLTCVKNKRK